MEDEMRYTPLLTLLTLLTLLNLLTLLPWFTLLKWFTLLTGDGWMGRIGHIP